MYQSIKHFTGYSTCFRQQSASSHCRFLHGYALRFKVVFECKNLNAQNWCYDFGETGAIKFFLSHMFDHTTVISRGDKDIDLFRELDARSVIQLRIIDQVSCELFAKLVYEKIENILSLEFVGKEQRVWIRSVTCYEGTNNAAVYEL